MFALYLQCYGVRKLMYFEPDTLALFQLVSVWSAKAPVTIK